MILSKNWELEALEVEFSIDEARAQYSRIMEVVDEACSEDGDVQAAFVELDELLWDFLEPVCDYVDFGGKLHRSEAERLRGYAHDAEKIVREAVERDRGKLEALKGEVLRAASAARKQNDFAFVEKVGRLIGEAFERFPAFKEDCQKLRSRVYPIEIW